MQTPDPHDVRRCQRFLRDFENTSDPTWGFCIYGTYTRKQPNETADASKENQIKEDNTELSAIVDKLRTHAADYIRYSRQVAFKDRILDALRLEPAAYLPGASLSEVATHFYKHYASRANDEICGAKYSWCLVIDDEALQSIQDGPNPIGAVSIENLDWMRVIDMAHNASDVYVKLLCSWYNDIKEPEILTIYGRGRSPKSIGNVWEGWLKFRMTDLMAVHEFLKDADDIKDFTKGPDHVLELN